MLIKKQKICLSSQRVHQNLYMLIDLKKWNKTEKFLLLRIFSLLSSSSLLHLQFFAQCTFWLFSGVSSQTLLGFSQLYLVTKYCDVDKKKGTQHRWKC